MTNDVYVEVDTNVINANINNIVKEFHEYDYYIGVIKGNCYGHGAELVKYIKDSGLNYLAVSTLEEALEVRKLVDIPILCMQPIALDDLMVAYDNNITITVSSYDYFKELIKKKIKLKIHLKLDTGMNRLGISDNKEVEDIYNSLLNNDFIFLEGIYTHMQTLGLLDTKWNEQISKFLYLTSLIDLSRIKIVHIYNTNSLCYHPKLPFCNGIRFGILMYGVCPRSINYNGLKGLLRKKKHQKIRKKLNIGPILNDVKVEVTTGFKLKSRIIEIKNIKKDEYIGYGFKYKVKDNTRVAVVPIGYADGLSLSHSLSYVYINENRYQIVGSINMKMITVLVNKDVKVNDEVEIINSCNIRELCSHNNITPHYLFTTIPSNIKRIYIRK